MVPTLRLVENSNFCVPVNFFCKNKIIVTGEPMHTASKEMVPHAPATNYRLKSEISTMLRCQLLYAQLVTQHYESRTV